MGIQEHRLDERVEKPNAQFGKHHLDECVHTTAAMKDTVSMAACLKKD